MVAYSHETRYNCSLYTQMKDMKMLLLLPLFLFVKTQWIM